jgi:hypothetical protein
MAIFLFELVYSGGAMEKVVQNMGEVVINNKSVALKIAQSLRKELSKKTQTKEHSQNGMLFTHLCGSLFAFFQLRPII